ncbi:MarR family winged helix-turn-helix transcriptional regulator [Pedobacter sp. L105]|uniref:MarR family winged helix-turn-helix transcriptional regulator n=1 Tax=Pedobacter sp. L105 TaxID=1641871 RepID=UPI00131BB4AC|nr:MarR family transcriptional regulator [Pedobacter sp. L105]
MEPIDDNERLMFRLIYYVKRLTDKWAVLRLPEMTAVDFNVTFLPYFMNIGNTGISNHELVNKIKVTKQGVSKTVKELENLGLAYTGKDENDARSIMIYLTEDGKALYAAVKKMADELSQEYIKLVGAKKYDSFIDTLIKIASFHEGLDQS